MRRRSSLKLYFQFFVQFRLAISTTSHFIFNSRRHIVLLLWIESSCLQINWQYCVRACLWRWHGVCGHYCDPEPRPGTSVSVNSNWWPAKEKLKAPGWWLGGRVGPSAQCSGLDISATKSQDPSLWAGDGDKWLLSGFDKPKHQPWLLIKPGKKIIGQGTGKPRLGPGMMQTVDASSNIWVLVLGIWTEINNKSDPNYCVQIRYLESRLDWLYLYYQYWADNSKLNWDLHTHSQPLMTWSCLYLFLFKSLDVNLGWFRIFLIFGGVSFS